VILGQEVMVVVTEEDWLDESDFGVIQWIFQQVWKEELGFIDLDAVSWEINIGCNFHGVPETEVVLRNLARRLGKDPDCEQDVTFTWTRVTLTDSAS